MLLQLPPPSKMKTCDLVAVRNNQKWDDGLGKSGQNDAWSVQAPDPAER
jgi:hypothetical protein